MSFIKANIRESLGTTNLSISHAELRTGRYNQEGDLEILIHSSLKSPA